MTVRKTAIRDENDPVSRDFIRTIVAQDVARGAYDGNVVTRFPPEPNGYLHIGHAKSICLNFGVAQEFGGRCHLRFDDTNPETEDMHYVDSIIDAVRWLGFEWGEHLYFASDYFEQLYDWAVELVKAGKAYVDDLSFEEIRAYRGTVTESGRPSPYRGRSVEENLDQLTLLVHVVGEDGSDRAVGRAVLDTARLVPGVTEQLSAIVPGLDVAEGEAVMVELEYEPAADALTQYPEYRGAGGPEGA